VSGARAGTDEVRAVARPRPVTDPLVVELAVLGIRMRLETNSIEVREAAIESFGTPIAPPCDPAVLHVRVEVFDESAMLPRDARGQIPVRHLCPDPWRLLVESEGGTAMSDPARREAVARVSRELVADRAHFRDAVLEAMTLALMATQDRHPIHAAGIVDGPRALLLVGPSGSGKSTLAYVAQRAGLGLLSDDHVWVQLEPSLRVWGRPSGVRLLPGSPHRFPELAGHRTAWRGGKEKLHVRIEGADRGQSADDMRVCLLRRGDTAASLRKLDARAVADGLTRRVDAGFDRYPARHELVVAELSRPGGWELALSDDATDAVPLLRRMLKEET
jgi:hypothetical protein